MLFGITPMGRLKAVKHNKLHTTDHKLSESLARR